MERENNWEQLVGSLDAWTSAAGVTPNRIEVSVPQGEHSRQVQIVMTPEEWDDMAGVMWGDLDEAVEEVKRTLVALRPDEGLAVYSEYRLEPSSAAVLPEPPEITQEPGGRWVAYNRDGHVASRFAVWSEPGEQP